MNYDKVKKKVSSLSLNKQLLVLEKSLKFTYLRDKNKFNAINQLLLKNGYCVLQNGLNFKVLPPIKENDN